jgi:hypothetical protein
MLLVIFYLSSAARAAFELCTAPLSLVIAPSGPGPRTGRTDRPTTHMNTFHAQCTDWRV